MVWVGRDLWKSPCPPAKSSKKRGHNERRGEGIILPSQPTKQCKHTPGRKVGRALGARTIKTAEDRAEHLPWRESSSQDGPRNAELVWELSEPQLMAGSPCRGDSSGRCSEQAAGKGRNQTGGKGSSGCAGRAGRCSLPFKNRGKWSKSNF